MMEDTNFPAETFERILLPAGWKGAEEELTTAAGNVIVGGCQLQTLNARGDVLLRLDYLEETEEIYLALMNTENDLELSLVLTPGVNLATTLETLVGLQATLDSDELQDSVMRLKSVCPQTDVDVGAGERVDAEVFFLLGSALRDLNEEQPAKAAATCEEVLRRAPLNGQAFEYLAQARWQLDDLPGFLETTLSWREACPDQSSAWMWSSIAFQNNGKLPEALEAINAAFEVSAASPEPVDGQIPFGETEPSALHQQKACVLALSGNTNEALKSVRAAIEADPDVKEELAEDEDLAALRDLKVFKKLIA